ncbi:hypothetical protein BC826DRAFT_1046644, partial [Russula brevipes]
MNGAYVLVLNSGVVWWSGVPAQLNELLTEAERTRRGVARLRHRATFHRPSNLDRSAVHMRAPHPGTFLSRPTRTSLPPSLAVHMRARHPGIFLSRPTRTSLPPSLACHSSPCTTSPTYTIIPCHNSSINSNRGRRRRWKTTTACSSCWVVHSSSQALYWGPIWDLGTYLI